jgi:hypothetical protein
MQESAQNAGCIRAYRNLFDVRGRPLLVPGSVAGSICTEFSSDAVDTNSIGKMETASFSTSSCRSGVSGGERELDMKEEWNTNPTGKLAPTSAASSIRDEFSSEAIESDLDFIDVMVCYPNASAKRSRKNCPDHQTGPVTMNEYIDELIAEKEKLLNINQTLKTELASQEAKNQGAGTEIDQLKQDKDNMHRKLSDKIDRMKEECNKNDFVCQEQAAEIARLNEEGVKHREAIASLKEELLQKCHQIDRLKEECNKNDAVCHEQAAEIARLNEESVNHRQAIASLKEELLQKCQQTASRDEQKDRNTQLMQQPFHENEQVLCILPQQGRINFTVNQIKRLLEFDGTTRIDKDRNDEVDAFVREIGIEALVRQIEVAHQDIKQKEAVTVKTKAFAKSLVRVAELHFDQQHAKLNHLKTAVTNAQKEKFQLLAEDAENIIPW